MTIHRIARHPVFWFALQAGLLLVWLAASGRLEPVPVTDTETYVEIPLGDLRGALTGIRTLGYPLFLGALESIAPGFRLVPVAQTLAVLVAAALFSFGLTRFGLSSAQSVAAGTAVAWGKTTYDWVSMVSSDSLGLSMAVMAIGSLLWTLASPKRIVPFCVLAATTAFSYHVRPAYLFLIPLIPILGAWFGITRLAPAEAVGSDDADSAERWDGVRLVTRLTLATVAPFFLYCLVRMLVVGHFGLVSFGGYNLVGITGQFLDDDLRQEMPASLKPLTTEILRRRRGLSDWEPPDNYLAMERMYNLTVWKMCVPAAEEIYDRDPVTMNRSLGQLSREIVTRRPGDYARWLRWAFRDGVESIVFLSTINKPSLLCTLMLILLQFFRLWRFRSRGAPDAPGEESDESRNRQKRQRFVSIQCLLWLAIGFATSKLLLVILVETPLHRYLAPASVFFPALITVFCLNAWTTAVRVADPAEGDTG